MLSVLDPSRRHRFLLSLVLLLASGTKLAHAQGGPPFLTDDPETPGNHHWEINFGWTGDRNPGQGSYEVPDFDINYGLGDRIQLKYEIPIAIAETRTLEATPASIAPPGHVVGGLGESLMGVKWRFYEHHPGNPWLRPNARSASQPGSGGEEPRVDFSVSTYPQLWLDNPTRSVPRGVVNPGPDFFLPIEINGRLGPIRVDTEFGYHFGNKNLQQTWIRGLLVGHEFTEATEAYAEIYDEQDATRLDGEPKQRALTLGAGGRHMLNKDKSLVLLLMGGRSIQTITPQNSQPSWVAYVGLQVLLGPKEAERQ